MAKVENNIFVRGLSGTLGGQFVVKQGRNCTIVSKQPVFDENRTFTEAQVDRQSKFREAVAYAKGAKGWTVYVEKAKATNRTPYHVAISDFCHAPEITNLDMSAWNGEAGQVLRVQVVDDVKVTQVSVVITDEAGNVLEQGPAVQGEGTLWTYTTTVTTQNGVHVVVTARDLPGNITEFQGSVR
jgi:hypothetical protein